MTSVVVLGDRIYRTINRTKRFENTIYSRHVIIHHLFKIIWVPKSPKQLITRTYVEDICWLAKHTLCNWKYVLIVSVIDLIQKIWMEIWKHLLDNHIRIVVEAHSLALVSQLTCETAYIRTWRHEMVAKLMSLPNRSSFLMLTASCLNCTI